MAISTDSKPTIYCNLHENTDPDLFMYSTMIINYQLGRLIENPNNMYSHTTTHFNCSMCWLTALCVTGVKRYRRIINNVE